MGKSVTKPLIAGWKSSSPLKQLFTAAQGANRANELTGTVSGVSDSGLIAATNLTAFNSGDDFIKGLKSIAIHHVTELLEEPDDAFHQVTGLATNQFLVGNEVPRHVGNSLFNLNGRSVLNVTAILFRATRPLKVS